MRLHGRLLRLERRLGAGDGGCAACRDRRGLVVLVAGRFLADGTAAREGEQPAACGRCGGVPERVVEIVEAEVETREDAARAAAGGWTGLA